MAQRDVIISAFGIPPQSLPREIAMPLNLFKEEPHVIGLSGIGSNTFMAPSDTTRAPREPWGGKPFAREALMYKDADGSVLRRLLQSQARGIDVRRICLIGFSAGGTFVHKVLESEIDRKMIDVVIMLDALHLNKYPSGAFIQSDLDPFAKFGANALMAGVRAKTGTNSKDPFLGPVFVSSHTNIKQSAALEKIVGNTTASTAATFEASIQALQQLPEFKQYGGSPRHIETKWSDMVSGFPANAFPCTIGPNKAGFSKSWASSVAAPTKEWQSMPAPLVKQAWGNFYDLDYGGTVGADHVFQSWHVQRAMWQTFLVPRWNAETTSPYSVAGLGLFEKCCPGPGGNFVPSGVYPTGPSLLWGLGAAAAGFMVGKTLLEK